MRILPIISLLLIDRANLIKVSSSTELELENRMQLESFEKLDV